jgi:endonuclease/exonuclease/phosphatase family metal-dependent hydrolase
MLYPYIVGRELWLGVWSPVALSIRLVIFFTFAGLTLPAETSVRIASWNLNSLRGGAASQVGLRELAATHDVIALQELPGDSRSGFAARLGLPASWHAFGFASNAIAGRYPIRRSGVTEVSVNPPRHLPWVEMETPQGPLVVYSIHLTYRLTWHPFLEHQRAYEARLLLRDALAFDAPVVLAGDFNSLGWVVGGHEELSVRTLRTAGFQPLVSPGDTHRLLGKLDWIFVRGLRGRAGDTGAYQGSDHRWIHAQVGPGTPPAQPPAFLATIFPNLGPITIVLLALVTAAFAFMIRRLAYQWQRPRTKVQPPVPLAPVPADR